MQEFPSNLYLGKAVKITVMAAFTETFTAGVKLKDTALILNMEVSLTSVQLVK